LTLKPFIDQILYR